MQVIKKAGESKSTIDDKTIREREQAAESMAKLLLEEEAAENQLKHSKKAKKQRKKDKRAILWAISSGGFIVKALPYCLVLQIYHQTELHFCCLLDPRGSFVKTCTHWQGSRLAVTMAKLVNNPLLSAPVPTTEYVYKVSMQSQFALQSEWLWWYLLNLSRTVFFIISKLFGEIITIDCVLIEYELFTGRARWLQKRIKEKLKTWKPHRHRVKWMTWVLRRRLNLRNQRPVMSHPNYSKRLQVRQPPLPPDFTYLVSWLSLQISAFLDDELFEALILR